MDGAASRPPSQEAAPAGDAGRRPVLGGLSLHRLFALKRVDRPVLALVAPLFAVTTAASVVLATFTRAVFLTEYQVSMLPVMFLGSAVFTALASLGYVVVIEKVTLTRRFISLLAVAVASFGALHLAYDIHPQGIALVQLVWCTGISHLVLIQSWNMMSALVPARQGKRLFPVLAAVSTLGAALGGGLVHVLLKVVEARHLMWLVLLLLTWPLLRIGGIVRALSRTSAETASEVEAPVLPTAKTSTCSLDRGSTTEISRGFESILRSPLLGRLAALVFLLQVASLIIDFQFSTELKMRYTRDDLAGFLGIYYGVSNGVAFLVALLATGRILRVVGIGIAISASAVIVGIGSGAYFLAATAGLGATFWAIVATSFAERIGQFALTKNAMQLLVMPLDTRKGERAKTLIDGVVYRVATAAVSIVLLLLAPTAQSLGMLAPAAILACIGVVGIGLSMGPHYRRALFEGLRARRVDADPDPQTRALLVRAAMGEVRQRLRSVRPREIIQALDIAKESKLPIEMADLAPVARSEDPEVARRALEMMNDLGLPPDRELLVGLLASDRPPPVLREVLRLLARLPDPALAAVITQYIRHPDAGVARLALMWLKAAGGAEQHKASIDAELLADLRSDVVSRRARAAYISGGYGLDTGPDLSQMLEDPSPQVRLNAVLSMGQVGSPEFIDPLVRCLGRGDTVQAASDALYRYGPSIIGRLGQRLADESLGIAIRQRLLRIIERFGNHAAVDLLMAQADEHTGFVRDHAILSLWRIAREPERPRPPHAWLRRRILHEIDTLRRYQHIEAMAAGFTTRHVFFLAELHALRLRADVRGFRLLGLYNSRAAMHRAYLHYRSPDQRVRSTAIELLDQHILDATLKPFVGLVERAEHAGAFAGSADTPAPGLHSTPDGLGPILGEVEPWLGRVWAWAERTKGGKVARDPMDMVFLLKGVPLFSDLSGEQLLPLTEIVQHAHVESGDLVFAEGQTGNHLYVILDGEVEVMRAGECVAVLGTKECFGEMALLDRSVRSASIRARKDVDLLAIARDDFQDLLDLHPALARGVIRVLTQRLRVATEAVSAEHHR